MMNQNWSRINTNVLQGHGNGYILWQPRIGAWWHDRIFFNQPFPKGYSNDIYEIYRKLGVSARLYEYNTCFRRIEDPRVSIQKKALNQTDTEYTVNTPVGKQVYIWRQTPDSYHHITLKWEVESEEELKVATWREDNTAWEWDEEKFLSLRRKIDDLGAPAIYMPRMNIQCLYIEKMGVENATFAIYDYPDTVESFFRARDESCRRMIQKINASPIKIINFGENVHAGTLSPNLFVKYHLPECQRRCELLHRAGNFCYSHWDGDTKPLLQFLKDTGLDGIEAITPKPQGDVTLEEIKTALGDNMWLLDGIPAVFFDHTYSTQELIDCVHRLIDLFAPRLLLGISDEISSNGDIERIKTVTAIVNEYNARLK